MEGRVFRWVREERDKELVIVPRDEWGGPPLLECEFFEKPYLQSPVPNVILTYTDTDTCHSPKECKEKLLEMHLAAVERGLWTVPFNFVVGGDGTVYEGRGWRRKPERSRVFPTLWGESVEIAHFGRKDDGGDWRIRKNFLSENAALGKHFSHGDEDS